MAQPDRPRPVKEGDIICLMKVCGSCAGCLAAAWLKRHSEIVGDKTARQTLRVEICTKKGGTLNLDQLLNGVPQARTTLPPELRSIPK